jgi:DOMON domain/Electron transfer DM13
LKSADGSSTYRLEFPAGKSINDILGGSISVWCEQFSANFGHVVVPTTVAVAQSKASTDLVCKATASDANFAKTPEGYNCENLSADFQVRWLVEETEILIELIGRVDEQSYMGFGPSGSTDKTNMDGADPVIADFFDGEFRARDYYMISRNQCSNGQGVCPDDSLDELIDDSSDVSGQRNESEGITLIRYKRPLQPTNANATEGGLTVDLPISVVPGEETFIVWALGPISTDTGFPNFHSIDFARVDISIDFGRDVVDKCVPLIDDGTAPDIDVEPFERPVITDTTEFNIVMGPSGGDKGYAGITGRTAWYVSYSSENSGK